MGMNVNLTPQLEALVRAKVSLGLYISASEVVREALRLRQEHDRLREAKLEELCRDVRRGLDRLDAAGRWSGNAGALLLAWRWLVGWGSQAAVGVCRYC